MHSFASQYKYYSKRGVLCSSTLSAHFPSFHRTAMQLCRRCCAAFYYVSSIFIFFYTEHNNNSSLPFDQDFLTKHVYCQKTSCSCWRARYRRASVTFIRCRQVCGFKAIATPPQKSAISWTAGGAAIFRRLMHQNFTKLGWPRQGGL